MKVNINRLSVDAYNKLIELYGRQIFRNVRFDTHEGTYYVTLDKYAIIKTGDNEVKIDLGARCYYLSCQDFCNIEVF